ncbi:MAG: hypothetical protein IJS14_01255 [Lentisphaeria bacterium]|nr:hypothetical protein [Lentisphaeria bacterium]
MKKITGVLSALLGAGLIASLTLNYCFYRKLSTPDPKLSQRAPRAKKVRKYNKKAKDETVTLAELLARHEKKTKQKQKKQPDPVIIVSFSHFISNTEVRIELSESVSGRSVTPNNLSKDYIRVSPEVPFSLNTVYGGFSIEGDFEPEKEYTFFIKKGLIDGHGEMKDNAEIRLKSPAMPTAIRLLTSGLVFPDKRANRTLPLQVSNSDRITVTLIRLYENNLGRYDIRANYWSDSIAALEYGKQIAKKEIALKLPRNREVNYALDLNRVIPPGETGVYGLILQPFCGEKRTGRQRMAVISVSDLAPQIVIDELNKTAFAAVRKLSDSSPCANAEVTLISRKFQTLASGKTDANGIIRLDYGRSAAGTDPSDDPDALLVKHGKDLVYVRDLRSNSHSLAEFGTAGNVALATPRALVYTERGVYRPGEKVYLTAWIRNPDLTVYANAPCKLNVRDPHGNTIFSFPGKTDANGLVHTDFVLPAAGPGGRLDVLCLPADGSENSWGSADFLAADFMPDRIKVVIKPDKPTLSGSNESAEFTFSAEYYFGGKLKDAPYRFAVTAVPAPKRPEWKDWHVGSRDFTAGPGFTARGKIRDGEVTQKYPGFAWTGGKACCPVLLNASASVSEPGGRAVTANTSVICHPTPFYIGLQSDSEEQNAVFRWKFLPADPDGIGIQPLPKDRKIRLVFTRHEWKYVLKKGDSITREWVREKIPAGEAEIDPGDESSGTFRHKLSNGDYTVSAVCGDMRTDMTFWHWYGEGGARSGNPAVISCKLDKEIYQPGETASVTLESPADGAVLAALGDRKLCAYRSFLVKAGSNTLKIALPADADTSACYAGLTLVAGENRQFGLVRIKLDQSKRKLAVTIRAKETAVPQEKIKVGISLASADGKPQKGMVQLFAVDEGILALTRYKTPDIFRHFYGAYECNFLFCDLYGLLYPDLKIDKDGKIGGGEAMGANPAADLNRDPRRAAPESAVRVLPPFPVDGTAEVEIALPDHLGAMRLMAVASAADRAGSAEATLKMRDKIDLMTTAPQVCAPGDETTVTFTMFNHDLPAGKMELKTDLPQQPAKVLTVGKGKNVSVPVRIKVPDKEGFFTFTATVKKDDVVKTRTVKIPVRLPNPKITVSHLYLLKPGEKWTPGKEIPQFAADARHQLTVSVSSRAAIRDALSWLNNYPYGCLEQTTSAAFPFLSADALFECGVISKDMAGTAQAKKYRAAARILSMMLYNGSFPMWQGGTETWQAGTVFAAHFLTAGKCLTDGKQEQMLLGYLKSLAQNATVSRYERAYACYVLASAGDKSMTVVTCARNLLNSRKDDYASFLAAAALIEAGYSGESWGPLKRLLGKEVWRHAGEVPYFMRETAVTGMTLYILMKIGADVPGAVAKLRQQLIGSLKPDGSGWGVTHSNAWAVLGLAELERTLPRGKAEVTVTGADGKPFKPDTEKGEPVVLTKGVCTVQNTGKVPVFVQYKATGVPVKAEPVRNSLRLTRTILQNGKAVKSAKQGDLLTVRLELDSTAEVEDLVISDLLPGGLEIEDERFATRAQGVPVAQQKMEHFRAKHEEKRPGEFILSGTVTSPGKTVVTYQARAVSCGKYALGSSSAEAMYEPELRAFEPGRGIFEVK